MALDSRQLRVLLLISLAAALPYLNALRGEFLSDDVRFVAQNPFIRSLRNVPSFFVSNESSDYTRDMYRPVRTASFALDYALWGLTPVGYHVTNILIHAANACLLFYLVRAITPSALAALVAACLFAAHPVQTESVAWIASRSDVQFALFFFLSYLTFLSAAGESVPSSRRSWLLVASAACFGLALLTKEMAAPLPLILLLHLMLLRKSSSYSSSYSGVPATDDEYDDECDHKPCCPNGNRPPVGKGDTWLWLRRAARLLWPLFVVLALYLVVRFMVCRQFSHGAEMMPGQTRRLSELPLVLCEVLWRYTAAILVPVNLSTDYLIQFTRITVTWRHVLGLLTALSALVVACWSARRGRVLAFAVAWFFVMLLPVSNILPIKAFFAERFLYVPTIAWPLGLAALLTGAGGPCRKGLLAALLCVLALYASLTAQRNHIWRDGETQCSDAVRKSPSHPHVHRNLGYYYNERGHYARAARSYERAVAAVPNEPVFLHSLAVAYHRLGKTDLAFSVLQTVVKLSPNHFHAHLNLGRLHLDAGRLEEAVRELELAAKLRPDMAEAAFCLGQAYERLGRRSEAVAAYRKSAALDPHNRAAFQAMERLLRREQ
ncbi:MAG: tetratricopeptide repeat protein [Planctomycetes bacterium]|nr:tetratricopeptide repeat protein [Planctomycetota bacterium]